MERTEETLIQPSFLSPIPAGGVSERGIQLFLKRDDLLHPIIQGNKWRKLEPVIQRVLRDKIPGILSFGGPFSNHLHALAAAGHCFGFQTAAVIRGLAADFSNPTLSDAQGWGMQLFPVSKAVYQTGSSHPEIQRITEQFPDFLILPEGGATPESAANCRAISDEIYAELDQKGVNHQEKTLYCCVPAGTGCTAAGLASGLRAQDKLLVFPAASYGVDLESIQSLSQQILSEIQIFQDYIFGGFAKFQVPLLAFARKFESDFGIQLDPIYSAKMMFGVLDLIEKDFFPENAVIVALHTGGLQGWRGVKE